MNIKPSNYKEHDILPGKFMKIGICNIPKQTLEIIQLCRIYVDIIA